LTYKEVFTYCSLKGGDRVKLAHINLTVNDVEVSAAFLETYFQLRRGGLGDGFAVLYDGDEQFLLTLMKGKDVQYPKTFHIGFIQESRKNVDQIYQRLKLDGYKVTPPVDHHGYGFYVQAPGGFTVEVVKRNR
jgi:lactoylglutathione lyase